ncbi:acetyl-CoA hydrolase/transferase C-terminal domain-containing protein [Pseudonocardia sp.]|jgi:acyl-CoA hydrolase|uniref:acetyl-CoA hydrolase/transferase C-terminal domain-containing protein n=1 Tax=Pseudonocardia sp. TaxID=60912 RepID=UPI003D0C7E6A
MTPGDIGARLAALVRNGDRLLVGTGAGEPRTLIRALIEHVLPMRIGVEIVQVAVGGDEDLAAVGRTRGHRVRFLAAGPRGMAAVRAGDAELFPASMAGIDRMIADGHFSLDGLLVAGTRAAGGRISPGLSLDVAATAARVARFRALECNAALPGVAADEWISESECALVVDTDQQPGTEDPTAPTEAQAEIGRQVAALIPDGAVLELGVGRGLAGVATALARREPGSLRIHTGLLTDDVCELVESGVVAGELPCAPGACVVGTAARGSAGFLRWLDDNPRVRLVPSGDAHDAAHLAGFARFTTVNSAGRIDLLGQVDCPSDDAMFGGGGLADYATAGALRSGSVIALEARDAKGRSKIVTRAAHPQLPGTAVTHVVTEFGTAVLRGATAAERALRIVQIAHPDDRERLAAEAGPGVVVGAVS